MKRSTEIKNAWNFIAFGACLREVVLKLRDKLVVICNKMRKNQLLPVKRFQGTVSSVATDNGKNDEEFPSGESEYQPKSQSQTS
jgi:hypothetical protein